MKLTIVGGGGLPRAARLRRAAGEGRAAAAWRRSSCTTSTPTRLDADRRACSTGSRPSTARGCRSAPRPTSSTRSQGADFVFCAIRVGQLEGRVIDEDVPLGLGVLGQETTGPGGICFALRTIPVMVRLAETIARARAERLADQLHQPRGDGHRGRPAGARRPRGRDLRLAVRALPARRRGGRARRRTSCGSTTSASTTSAGCAACATRAARSCSTDLLDDDARLDDLRGGPAVRRRVAALARDDPERVPLLLLLRVGHGQRDPRRRARAARSCSSSSARSTRATGTRRRRRWPTGAPPATTASAPTWPRRATPRATTHEHEHDANARLRERGDGGARGDRAQHAAQVLILNTANRSALPFLDERAVVEVPCVVGRAGPVPVAIGEVPAHARVARRDDEGRRAHDDRRGAARLARSWRSGARAAPARAVGDDRARDLRRLPRAAARAAGGVRVSRSTSPAPSRRFLDLTMVGLDAIPRPGEERLATDFLRSPGGGAITAVGAARLGLVERARLAARRRRVGILLRSLLADDGRALGRAARGAHAGDGDHAVQRRPRDGDL